MLPSSSKLNLNCKKIGREQSQIDASSMLLNQIIIQDSTIYVVNQKYIYGYISREENFQYKDRVVCSLQRQTTSSKVPFLGKSE